MSSHRRPARCAAARRHLAACAGVLLGLAAWADDSRHAVPTAHPRLLGSRAELQSLARARPEAWRRTLTVARDPKADVHARLVSLALGAAIESSPEFAREAKALALRWVDGPIRQGHVPFGQDLALSALAYDLAHEAWTDAERQRMHTYLNRTVDANRESETHVFHNAWYGYKQWGIGLAAYATYHENPRSPALLAALEREFRERAAPALELAGQGGGWAEGYYVHYWSYEWLVFCEVARRCEGVDYLAWAPGFFRARALASAFEMFPGLREYGSRRPIPMGDGGGRSFGGDRDKALSARRILVSRYPDDPVAPALHAFNETTPRSSVGQSAYQDFLWRDPQLPRGDLSRLPLSHFSPGPGHVYARSDWTETATHFFFKCSDRFTAHQHLDAGHFGIFKFEELTGDGGQYDDFGSVHDVNYHLRSIAHSTVLVHDPAERWPGIRAGRVTGNDGGQHHAFPHHNGAVADPVEWERTRAWHDIADIPVFEERGTWLHVAADATRAYASNKVSRFTRQIVYLRPDTFVVLDQVQSTRPDLHKTWLLQCMKPPVAQGSQWVLTHGRGRLFLQPLLPKAAAMRLVAGPDLYRYGGETFEPTRSVGAAPECRLEIRPARAQARDLFLQVLTAAAAERNSAPVATVEQTDETLTVVVGDTTVRFQLNRLEADVSGRPAR